jgi:anti-sigma-K factor RskA
MTNDDDIDGLAAEYVLGSLTLAERKAVNVRRRTDVALSQAVEAWEKRLASLGDQAPEIEPPSHLFAGILTRISQAQDIRSADVIALRRRAGRWRKAAVGASALAACLALMVGWLFQNLPASPTALVAILSPAGTTADENAGSRSAPAFVVTIDLRADALTVRPLAARPAPRRSYELWLMHPGSATPSSLGVISQSEPTTVPWRARYPPSDFVNGSLAISLEPEGGSPTRAPTGPIMFVGKLVQSTP